MKIKYWKSSREKQINSIWHILPDIQSTNPNILTLYQFNWRVTICDHIATKTSGQIQLVLPSLTPVVWPVVSLMPISLPSCISFYSTTPCPLFIYKSLKKYFFIFTFFSKNLKKMIRKQKHKCHFSQGGRKVTGWEKWGRLAVEKVPK